MSLKGFQKKQAWWVAICASVLLCSCHSKEWVAQNAEVEPALIVPISKNADSRASSSTQPMPLPRLGTSRSKTHSSNRSIRGHKIASSNDQKNSSRSDAKMLKASPLLRANYKIAGIGHAQDPSAINNWNWARDFGGTVDAVTIGF